MGIIPWPDEVENGPKWQRRFFKAAVVIGSGWAVLAFCEWVITL